MYFATCFRMTTKNFVEAFIVSAKRCYFLPYGPPADTSWGEVAMESVFGIHRTHASCPYTNVGYNSGTNRCKYLASQHRRKRQIKERK